MEAAMMGAERTGDGWLEAWSLTSMWCCYLYHHMGPMGARYVYGVLFLIGIFTAWGLRGNPMSFFLRQRLSGCHQGNRACLEAEAVLLISFTLFLFFCGMFLSTVGTRYVHGVRNSWHCRHWVEKTLCLAVCVLFSIYAPTGVTKLYGKVAPFGAWLFLFIQLISVIRCITQLNSRWCGVNYQNNRKKVNGLSIAAYLCCVVGIVIIFFWYNGRCGKNTWMLGSTIFLVHIMPIIILAFTKAKGFYMEPLLMGVYIVFLCWSAIKSEPRTSSCYTGSGVKWLTITSFIVGLISVAVAALSTGSTGRIQFTNAAESENEVPYGYGFFHLVFAGGSMYFGMLILGWDTQHVTEGWSMDIGWKSTIVHLVNEGLAAILLVVVVLARCSEIGWLQMLLENFFGGIGGQHQLGDESGDIELPRLPREPPAPEHEQRTETDRPPQDPSLATDEDNNGRPQAQSATEPVGTEKRDNAQASSSSSTIGPLGSLESEPPVLERRRQRGEIDEPW